VARFAPYPLDLVLKFELFLFQSANFDVIRAGTCRNLTDFLFECPMLLCEFREMSSDRHQLPPREIADVEIVPHVSHVVQRVVNRDVDV
jgi:hypothetical protein